MPVYQDPAEGVIVEAPALRAWTQRLVQHIGTPLDIASDVAEILLTSDLRGIASHGTARLPQYLRLVETGVMDPAARPAQEKGKPALIRFNANNGWGHHAARIATEDAIRRARELGAAISLVRNTNHYGIAGWYAMRVAQEGLIGISLTNAAPMVAPTRARLPMLGTNPIAVAAPAGRFGMVVLDMATSTIPRGRIEVAARRGEPIPPEWAIGPDGCAASTPESALSGALQPLGGREETSGYKGYGLGLMVELLTGVLGNAAIGPHILGLFSVEGNSNLGQFFLAIDPDALADNGGFEARLEQLVEELTSAPLIPNAPGPVLFPGQPEAERAAYQERHGIALDQPHHACLLGLADAHGLQFPDTVSLPRAQKEKE